MADQSQETTDFGFRTVARDEKQAMVADVFHSVAAKYDVMNDLMSFGIHRIWKRFTIDCSGVRRGQRVLDLAGGTGDLAAKFSRMVGEQGQVVLADINDSMLKMGREKLRDRGIVGNINYVQANAEALPFPDNYFDCITISFGLRNVTDKDKALRSMFRVLKPGGRLLVLEFSKPLLAPLSKAYDAYSFHVLPKIGELVVKDPDSYRYLAESIRMHPDQETLKGMMGNAGFENVTYFNLTGGIVALHRGFKSEREMPMLFTPLLTGALETSLNNLLFRDRSMKAARQRLAGKVLRIELEELASPLVLVFSELRVDVLGQSEDSADCTVRSRIPSLLKLRDRQQLPVLMRSGELTVEGDIQVVQQLVGLLDLAEWDPAEWLAPYIGDIAAQGITQALGKGASLLKAGFMRRQQDMAEALTEEWRLAPGPLEVVWFNEEVDALARSAEALIARMDKLEGKR